MATSVAIREVSQTQRKMRHPNFPFSVDYRPWELCPFMIAPVLPGETLKNGLLQARIVSDPVKSSLLGWWHEYWFYYVKHRDLDGRDTFSAMMTDPSTSLAAFNLAATTSFYHGTSTISWVKECLARTTEYYHRFEGEAWDDYKFTTYPLRSINQQNWLDSLESNTSRAAIADVDVDLDSNLTITASEVDKAMWQWQLLRTQGLTNISYEDYLRSFGVRPALTDIHKPELLRYVKDWTYPTNHIDPTDGSPTSAVVWKVAERMDKDRFFTEPGFVFGVCAATPKVYLKSQIGSATDLMTDLYSWLPAILRDDVEASAKKIAATTAPLSNSTDAYWVDLKDLLLYGEQFTNLDMTTVTDRGVVALPTAALQKRYASSTDADGLFSSASPANKIRADGIVTLSVASSVQDTSTTTA